MAVAGTGGGEGVAVLGRHQLAIAQLDGVDGTFWQGRQKSAETLCELPRGAETLGSELEKNRAAADSNSFAERGHHLVGGIGRIEKQRVGLAAVDAVAIVIGPAIHRASLVSLH